ncbi:MAG: F-type H+-transporting ATPase subunit b [Hyphomicrobiaceae bacterium]|jgi:F-type H+-transporting ATPase subunit b
MLTFPPDGTFLVQLFSFFVLLFLLKRMLFDPFQELLVEREQRTEGDAQLAISETAEAEALAARVERDLAKAREEAMTEVDALRRETKEKESALFGEARDSSAAKLGQMRSEISVAREEASTALRADAAKLASQMVSAVLGRGADA